MVEILLLKGQRLACRHAKLLADEINAGHLLGDRMLDLNAGIHLAEIEIAVVIDQKFDRARVAVADALCQRTAAVVIFSRSSGVTKGRRAFLDQLLMAALHRALTLEQMHHIAVAVAQNLHLDMEWNGMEWNGMEWNGMEWNGMEWNGMENGMEWNGMEWNGMEWNGMEWNGMEWNGMEWNGMEWNARIVDIFHVQAAVTEIGDRLRRRAVVRVLEVRDLCATRMPLPPPPDAALSMTG